MLENYIDQIITMGTLADSVTIIDDQQIIRHFQPFNPDIVPFTASDVVGTHFRSTFLDVDPADSGVLRALHGESTISRAYTHLLFNGQRSSGIESIFPIRMGDSIIGSISVSRFLSSPNRFLDVKDDPSVSPDLAEIPDMIGNSPAMQTLKRQILRVARTDANVLICGETGTGKELVAHAVHTASPRRTVRPSPHLFWKAPFLVQKKGHTQAPYTPKGSWSRPMEAPFFWMRSTPSIRPSRERSCGPWRPKSSAVWEAPGRSRVISVLFQP